MAVYQGARLRTSALPAAETAARSARVPAPAVVGDGPRVRPMGLLMASIVVATMLGLAYLTQTLGSNATNSEITALESQRYELLTQIHRDETLALSMTQAEDIVPKARKQKLKWLGEPIVLPAP
jgi:hypothetical protein